MGHGAWRMKIITMPNTSLRETAPTTSLRDATRTLSTSAQCPMPNAQCPMPNAQLIQNSYERYS